jgi:hypothetical protein
MRESFLSTKDMVIETVMFHRLGPITFLGGKDNGPMYAEPSGVIDYIVTNFGDTETKETVYFYEDTLKVEQWNVRNDDEEKKSRRLNLKEKEKLQRLIYVYLSEYEALKQKLIGYQKKDEGGQP